MEVLVTKSIGGLRIKLLNIKRTDNILFCAYRDWGIKVFNNFKNKNSCNFLLAKNKDEFNQMLIKYKPIIIVLLGWSWILKKEIVNDFYVIGIHPSDLPKYSGGSLQLLLNSLKNVSIFILIFCELILSHLVKIIFIGIFFLP